MLSLLITLLLGSAVGSGLRYVIGTNSERPTAAEIAGALSIGSAPIVEIRRVPDSRTDNRRYRACSRDGGLVDVMVFDRDQQAADAFYRIYRRVRLRSQVSRSAPVTVSRAVERGTLMAYAVEDAGVPTPRLQAALRVGPEAGAIATTHHDGTTLADLAAPPSDEVLGKVFDQVLQLHRHRVTHRALTADHILLTGADGDEVMLLDPGDGDVAASDLQIRLDLAQLTATIALLVGPERAAALARAKLGTAACAALVPLLQPVVLHRSTRAALRRRKDVLPALRKGLVGSVPGTEVAPVQLERIRPRGVITLVATIFAAYIVIGQFGSRNFAKVLKQSDWRWVLVALALSAVTYIGATWSLTGFVLEKLNMARTFLAQLAGSFVTLVTPAAVGGVALNIRYLNKAKVPPAEAASSVGVSQVFAFALHLMLLVIFIALTGGSHSTSIRPPSWAYIALAALVAVVLVVLALPAGRRLSPLPGRPGPRPGHPAAARHRAEAGQAGRGHRRRAAADLRLYPLPGRVGPSRRQSRPVLRAGRGLPDRKCPRLYRSDARRPWRSGDRPVRRPDRHRPRTRRRRAQRRAAVPADHVLAADSGRLGRAELPAATRRALTRRAACARPPAPGPLPQRRRRRVTE